MRAIYLVALGAAALITFGCVDPIRVLTDEATVKADGYVTFLVLDGHSSGNAQLDQQIKSDVEMTLADKGWVEAPPGEAEAVVVAHVATADMRSHDAFYREWGGWQWRGGDPRAAGLTDSFRPGTLVVDIFDAWTKHVIWRGSTTDAVSETPNTHSHANQKAVTRMFKSFPLSVVTADAGLRRDVNNPPIMFSPSPSLLVTIDGEPVYRTIPGTMLERIVNTPRLIVRDEAGMYHLKIPGGWMEAYTLTGLWSVSGTLPDWATTAPVRGLDTREIDGAPVTSVTAPTVYVSTTPTTLIVTDGEPQFAPVAGTSLLQVTNTTADVFKEPTDTELYVRASGRWFRAWTTGGPWEYVPDRALPADVASITEQ